MKINNVGETHLFFGEEEARAAMLACGFDESSLPSMEIDAMYDPRNGVIEVVVWADVGCWGGNNYDGWNKENSLHEIGNLNPEEIDATFGEGASNLPIWRAYLARRGE